MKKQKKEVTKRKLSTEEIEMLNGLPIIKSIKNKDTMIRVELFSHVGKKHYLLMKLEDFSTILNDKFFVCEAGKTISIIETEKTSSFVNVGGKKAVPTQREQISTILQSKTFYPTRSIIKFENVSKEQPLYNFVERQLDVFFGED